MLQTRSHPESALSGLSVPAPNVARTGQSRRLADGSDPALFGYRHGNYCGAILDTADQTHRSEESRGPGLAMG